MTQVPARHHRRSIRLAGFDHATKRAYFVTICAEGRSPVFGEVVDGEVRLNEPGRMVESVWNEIPAHYPSVEIDEFAVMPDYVHAILFLTSIQKSNDVSVWRRGEI